MRRSTMLLAIGVLWSPLLCAQAPALDPGPPPAVRNFVKGPFLGWDPLTHATLTSDHITGGRAVGGFGLAIRVGWQFSEHVAVLFDVPASELTVADTAEYFLGSGDLLVRLSGTSRALRRGELVPFVQVGGGLRDVSADFYTNAGVRTLKEFSGDAFTLGAGLAWRVGSGAVTSTFSWSTGTFTDERTGNITVHNRRIAGKSWRVQTGFEWNIRPARSKQMHRTGSSPARR